MVKSLEVKDTVKTDGAIPAPQKTEAPAQIRLRTALENEGLDPAQREHWMPIGDVAIDHIVAGMESPKMLSNVFNFESLQYITTCKNLLTGEKGAEQVGALDEFPNQGLVETAHQKLVALGKNPPAYPPSKPPKGLTL